MGSMVNDHGLISYFTEEGVKTKQNMLTRFRSRNEKRAKVNTGFEINV